MMNKRLQALKYIVVDLISASTAWVVFYTFRKLYLESKKYGYSVSLDFNQSFYVGLIIIPIFWFLFYLLSGYYRDPYRKSRLKELGQTLLLSIIGVIIIFFVLILDDDIASYKSYYISFLVLFLSHFSLTFLLRFSLTTRTAHRIHSRKLGFKTILIGSNENALNLYKELNDMKKSSGFKIEGFVHLNGNKDHILSSHIPHLGSIKDIKNIILNKDIEEVIIAIETSEQEDIGNIVNNLLGLNVYIKIIPGMYEILTGQVKMTSIFGAPLVEIKQNIMPDWQYSVKRTMDIFLSLFALIFLSPIYFFIGLVVKITSPGPVFFKQERIGKNGKPFQIIKFRSMYINAESSGPALSSENDPRITPFGRFMRKSRIDELPQFYNVLIGEMSIVGPRPERQYFIDKIIEKSPHYIHLQKVRPGITSWGQVKYGYAENVDQMVARLKYDILYIENMSLFLDIKILIYTVMIVLQGRGK